MIVDFHAHVFPDAARERRDQFQARDSWFAALYGRPGSAAGAGGDVLAAMDTAGVDRTVLVGFPWRDPGLCALHNDYLLPCVARYPDRLLGLAIVQPTRARRRRRNWTAACGPA